jgi:hypothetical protein
MGDTWKLRGGTPNNNKSADALTSENLTNHGQKQKIKGEYWN